jgi:hypothetical protein
VNCQATLAREHAERRLERVRSEIAAIEREVAWLLAGQIPPGTYDNTAAMTRETWWPSGGRTKVAYAVSADALAQLRVINAGCRPWGFYPDLPRLEQPA